MTAREWDELGRELANTDPDALEVMLSIARDVAAGKTAAKAAAAHGLGWTLQENES